MNVERMIMNQYGETDALYLPFQELTLYKSRYGGMHEHIPGASKMVRLISHM